jgi:hypothetical protein
MLTVIGPDRLSRAKRAFSTRRAPSSALRAVRSDLAPVPGDLVLARIDAIGQHERLELTDSRKAILFEGDEIIVAYGARYAPDQFEAEAPGDLGACALVAGGGIAGRVLSRHAKMADPTQITPIGLFVDETGAALNLRRFALKPTRPTPRAPAIGVVGGSMNAGKTTTAASIVRGFALAGFKVGAAKLTGTGAGNDFWHMSDAGAHLVLDFTDIGLATTYKASREDIVRGAETLASLLVEGGAEVLVFEIADGLFQAETGWLVASPALEHLVDAYVYAGESAASAVTGVNWLRAANRPVMGVSGLVSASPLAAREVEHAIGMRCLTKSTLATAELGRRWWASLLSARESAAA